MSEFLLEVGTEEIPHWMVPAALKDLERRFVEALGKFDLAEGVECRGEATGRRLTLIVSGLAERQADKRETLSGPPKNISFDADGKPTKAALGFAARAGVDAADLEVGTDGKLRVERTVAGRATAEILAETLAETILGVSFPKTMYWTGKQGPRFIRPIRWLLALLDGKVVEFEIAGVKSGDKTDGHRRLGRSGIVVSSAADYEAKLREGSVLLAADERRRRITDGCEQLFPASGAARVRSNDRLLETLTYLTEIPTVIRGDFDPSYLELPDEVLETVMLVHQKYFAVEDAATGALKNSFIAVANLDSDPEGEIRRGHERVLRARFNDAQFFWTADQKRSLVERVEDLKAVTFQAQLGSYHAKAERMAELIGQLCEDAQVRADAERAAMLAKCDLTTEMVGEFPELQGVVGGLYAAHQGEPQAVADAIYDHYKPAGPGDEVPRSAAGRWVSIADKLDTLRGMFGLGNIPTGSKDPFALRRAAAGVVRIVIEAGLPLTLDQLCGSGEHADKLREFFVDRLRHYLGEKGLRYDAINAVLAASDAQPTDVMARCEAIAKVRPTENFEPLAVSFKRIRNILEKAGGVEGYAAKPLEESRLEQGAEKDLFEAHKAVRAALQAESDYTKGLERIAALRPAVDRFFDDVLVMAKDEAVRENRLAFLARLLSELSTIADFSEIVSADE